MAGKRSASPLLTKGQEAFCQANAMNGGNGADAYATAYPKSRKWTAQARAVQASKLKANPKIQERISALAAVNVKVATDRYEVSIERVVRGLALLGFSNILDYVEPVPGSGALAMRLDEMDRDQAAAISEVTVEEYMDGKGEDARPVRRTKFKLHDKQAALVALGKHLGLFKAQVELTGKDGKPVEVTSGALDMNAARRIALMLTQAAAKGAGK